jgi:SAM-dependent methyltransferase
MDSRKGYDLLARYYDRLTKLIFGRSLHNAQLLYLNEIPPHSRVLVIGGGTGRWLIDDVLRKADLQFTYIDISPEMVTLAKIHGAGLNVQFITGTPALLHGGEGFDAVILFCFLDLLDDGDLNDMIRKITTSLKQKGIMLVTDFEKQAWWHALLLTAMYGFFFLLTGLKRISLPPWRQALVNHGYTELKHQTFYSRFIRTSVWLAP